MEKFSTEYFHKLANDLKFDLSDEEIEELKKDFVAVEKQVSLFEKVDTHNCRFLKQSKKIYRNRCHHAKRCFISRPTRNW